MPTRLHKYDGGRERKIKIREKREENRRKTKLIRKQREEKNGRKIEKREQKSQSAH